MDEVDMLTQYQGVFDVVCHVPFEGSTRVLSTKHAGSTPPPSRGPSWRSFERLPDGDDR
jgi:hypothetical protein